MSSSGSRRSLAAGISIAGERLSGRWLAVATGSTLAAALVAALILRRQSPADAADIVLAGAVFGWILPLFACAAVSVACLRGRLDQAVKGAARRGANRRSLVLGMIIGTSIRVAAVSAAVAAVAVIFARGAATHASLSDALTASWIAVLAASAYVGLFSFGSLFGKAGGGRTVAFLADWVAGAFSCVVLPRAHIRSLLGGELVAGLSAWQSTGMLYALTAAFAGMCALRVPR